MALANPIQVGWSSQWEQLANGINAYYGGGISSSQYQTVVNYLNSGEYTMEQMESILSQIPEMKRTYNNAGQLTGIQYTANVAPAVNTGGSVASQINSNVAQATAGKSATVVKDVQNVSINSQTGKATISNNVTKYNSGVAGQAKAVAGSALSAICATSAGITLGKTIDSALYNANPQFWDSHNMSSLNPETWASITQDSDGGLLDSAFNFIFQIDETTGNPQAYMDENAFAYMTAYMISRGVFDGEQHYEPPTGYVPQYVVTPVKRSNQLSYPSSGTNIEIEITQHTGDVIQFAGIFKNGSNDYARNCFCSEHFFTLQYTVTEGASTYVYTSDSTQVSLNGKTFYMGAFRNDWITSTPISNWHDSINTLINGTGNVFNWYGDTPEAKETAYIMLYGTEYSESGVDGINDQTSATQFDTSNISDPSNISDVLTALQTQFPELWDNRIEYSTDGQNQFIYIPVGFPTGGTGTQPTTNGASQADTSPQIDEDGDNVTDELIKTLIESITLGSPTMSTDTTTPVTPSGNPNPPDTGTGNTPLVIAPTGSASALWKIYNPSQSELDTFGAWLWSSNFVDQLLKVFNDPMQAIIALHKVFVTPSTSGSGVIKVGYLSSNATANYVDSQYVDVDCGSVDLTEYFGNVFDYEPFTKINLFLPFIGFVGLSVSDCMRGLLGVVYHVDVLTGQCLAEVSVTRDLHENVLYTYAGNCAVQYPVSSGSYVGIIGGLLGVAGAVVSGGALAPVAIGAMSAVGGIHTDIKHSGNIHGSAGAMGCKKPYVVIERPQTALPRYYDMIEGEPQNEYTTLSECTGGFVKVKKAVYNIPAERIEIDMIRNLLESGVYI